MAGELTAIGSVQSEFGSAAAYRVGAPTPLFARIDTEKKLAEIAAENPMPSEKAEAENVAVIAQIGIEDFAKVELRVSRVTDCEPIKKAKKLLKLTLDDGSGTPRTVCSGIAQWYTPDDLKGRSIVLVANLKPAVLCGVESQGMILAADDGGNVRVIFVDGVAPGSRVR
ncbi:Methionine--tRNA ligase [bioreactor metagenome]|uniref:Methionine--tRNA ligase n=1 Tax=bioreactor metagenome TaxID=1076179 RepID=A0A645IVJ0_9ZZZZ